MKKHIYRHLLVLFLAVGAISMTGCSSLSKRYNEAALVPVKKVALVGFQYRQPRGIGIDKDYSKEAEEIYQSLQASFGKKMKWKVVPVETMKQNPAYQAVFQKTMKGFQNKMPVSDKERQFLLDGVLDYDCTRILGASGRTALMKALGVDAIITSQVNVLLNGNTVMGIGNRYPTSRLSFEVFRPNQDVSDWFEGGLDGDEAKTSIGKTAIIDRDLMNRLAVESARSASNRIGPPTQN